jgi:hypothetical protein
MPVIAVTRRRQRPAVFWAAGRIASLLCLVSGTLHAQNAQPYAAQFSALFTTIRAASASIGGAGVELQQRFNRLYATEGFGALSLGLGGQYTTHTRRNDRLGIAGLFVEPRWVPATSFVDVFPYVSARLAVQRMTGEFEFVESGNTFGAAIGIGGGLAVKVSRQINIDAGAQLIRQQFGNIGVQPFDPFTTYTAKIGVSVGYPR